MAEKETGKLYYTVAREDKYAVLDAGLVMRSLSRGKWTIILSGIIGAGLAVLLALNLPDEYSASTRVLIDPQPSQLSTSSVAETNLQVNESVVESKSYIVKSNRVLERVVDVLSLAENPEFADPAAMEETEGDVPDLAKRLAMKSLNEAVVVRQAGTSFVLNIQATAYDPTIAADIANTIAQNFVELEQQAKLKTAKNANEWLLQRLNDMQGLVSTSAEKLANFRAVSGISVEQRISDLSQTLERLRLSLSEITRAPTSDANDARQAALEDRVVNTENQLRELTGKTVELRELERQADADRELYERFLERAKELDELANFQSADSRVIADALPPLQASGPRRKLIVILGSIFGVIIGVLILAIRQFLAASKPTVSYKKSVGST